MKRVIAAILLAVSMSFQPGVNPPWVMLYLGLVTVLDAAYLLNKKRYAGIAE